MLLDPQTSARLYRFNQRQQVAPTTPNFTPQTPAIPPRPQANQGIIRRVENDIEFYSIQATGESGISIRGLATLCGVRLSTLQNLLGNLTDKAPSEWLESLVGKELNLTDETITKQGGTVRPVKAEICALIIQHYAFKGNKTAQYSLHKFSTLGITQWIQGITGWTKAQPEAAPAPSPPKLPSPPSDKNQAEVDAKVFILKALDRYLTTTDAHGNKRVHQETLNFARLYKQRGLKDIADWVYGICKSCSHGSLHRWRKELQSGGREALLRKTEGVGRIATITKHPQLKQFIDQKLLESPRIGGNELYRCLQAALPDLGLSTPEIPSCSGIQRYVKKRRDSALVKV